METFYYVQLAHGSNIEIISGFSDLKELYQKVAQCYKIRSDDILFCTVKSNKIDMDEIVCERDEVARHEIIYVHVKGASKEVSLVKSEETLGVNVTDTDRVRSGLARANKAFIKSIEKGKVLSRHTRIKVGDHIESINSDSMVGLDHQLVALRLRAVPLGSTLHLGLVEPRREKEPVQQPVHTMQAFKAMQPEMVFHLVKVQETPPTAPPGDLDDAGHDRGGRHKEQEKLKKDLEEEVLKVVEENDERLEATLEAKRKENEKQVTKLKEKLTETQESHDKKLHRIIKRQMEKNRKQVTQLQDKLDKTVKENEESMKHLYDAQTAINAERLENLISEHMVKEVVLIAKYKAEMKKAGGGGAGVGRLRPVPGDYA